MIPLKPSTLTGLLGLLMLLVSLTAGADAGPAPPDRVVWDRTPIRVVLPVGEERLVHFPSAQVRVGVPESLPLRTLSVDGTVYWLAHEPFETTRVVIQGLDEDGGHYLIDLVAREDGPEAPLEIMRRGERAPSAPATPEEPHQNLDYVALTRFAAQQMYAPERLRPDPRQVIRAPVNTDPLPLLRGGGVEARPLIAWRHGGLHITVVRLQNTTGHAVTLDPRDLRGDWLAATFQHARLLPQGDEADTTAVYLISQRAFDESLGGLR